MKQQLYNLIMWDNRQKNNQDLLVVNELSEYSSVSLKKTLLQGSQNQIEMMPLKPKPVQIAPLSEEYAYTMTQHIQLIGDLASTDKTAVCTQNWKDNVRKQFNTQTITQFKTSYQINREIQLITQIKKTYVNLMPIIDPQSSFLSYWKIPVLIITFVVFIEVPLIIFFGDDFYYTFHSPTYIFFRIIVIVQHKISNLYKYEYNINKQLYQTKRLNQKINNQWQIIKVMEQI